MALTVALTISGCSGDGNRVARKQRFFRMDTLVEATVSVPRDYDAKPLWGSIDSLLAQCEKSFSVEGDSSEISAINARAANALPVSARLGGILRAGLGYGDTLGGGFDITVLPLKEAWGLCERCGGDAPLPDSATVSAALRAVSYKKIHINGAGDSAFFDSPDTRVDVGGIAKGFVIAWLAELMKSCGVDNFLISAGGDIIAVGRRPDGAPWRVGVRHPRNPAELLATIPLDSGAVFTSGDYERARAGEDGQRYHHIFDPANGYPCGKNQSLTIRAADPVRADILSTGLFCQNATDIVAFANARADIECLAVDSAGRVFASSGWQGEEPKK
jgi:thiamine biosynthesis lipoprotein